MGTYQNFQELLISLLTLGYNVEFSDYVGSLQIKLTKVINIETGEIYESIKQCAEMNNISYKTLGKRMSGELKNNTPFKRYENDRIAE